ncbi:MAG: hypothetical protein EOP04_03085 [Proteobacteria bacterium]|nr:MAG: hypothetical protein EOP04_03085 [Pseudomonadota bacterium]
MRYPIIIKHKIRAIFLMGGLAIASNSCGEVKKQESETDFTLGVSLIDVTRGHEDLTRFAVAIANQKIESDLGLANYFTQVPVGENAGRTSLPMVRGSFDTDWAVTYFTGERPGQELINFYGVGWIKTGSEWQDFPWLQSLHFLRDRDANNNVYSLPESLDSSRERASTAFTHAISLSKKRTKSHYWLGHLLHTVQDSFSTVHANRSADFKTILNLCTFGKHTAPDACPHPEPFKLENENFAGALLHEDRVWIDREECDGASQRGWECLKPEAQKAAEVSAGVLYLYAKIVGNGLRKPISDGFDEINDFMLNDRQWHGGYFKGKWEQ